MNEDKIVNESFIGKPVYQYWSRNLRFGVVVEEKIKKRWRYCKVDWTNDEIYEKSMNYLVNVRKIEYDKKYDWYRVDKVHVFEPNRIIDKLNVLINEVNKKEKSNDGK